MQDAFILKFTTVEKPQRKRPRKDGPAKTVHIKYFIPSFRSATGSTLVQVCQKMFISILSVSKTKVQRICKNHFVTGMPPTDKRGGDTRSMKYATRKAEVKLFIEKLVPIESYYCREKSNRQYLSSDLSIRKLWRAYNSIENPLLRVKYNYFREIFVNDYNISFGTPATDACSTCIQLREELKTCLSNSVEKQNRMTQLQVHKLRAKAFYEILRKENEGEFILSFDCQKNMVLPKVPDQSAYYSRQLYLYNFTVCVGSSKTKQTKDNTFIYTWTEDVRNKGSNEIVSAVHHRLQNSDLLQFDTVNLLADGAGGQNKNTTMVGMAMKWLVSEAPQNVKSVQIIFPVAGHSYIPPDRIFGRIERLVRKKDTIISPDEYLDIYSQVGTVLKMGEDFHVSDWKAAIKTVLKPTSKWHFQFQPTKRFIITKSKKGDALVQGEPTYRMELGALKRVSKTNCTAANIVPQDIPMGIKVNPAKIKDVETLLNKHFGTAWRDRAELRWYKEVLGRQSMVENEDPNEDEDEPMIDVSLFV